MPMIGSSYSEADCIYTAEFIREEMLKRENLRDEFTLYRKMKNAINLNLLDDIKNQIIFLIIEEFPQIMDHDSIILDSVNIEIIKDMYDYHDKIEFTDIFCTEYYEDSNKPKNITYKISFDNSEGYYQQTTKTFNEIIGYKL